MLNQNESPASAQKMHTDNAVKTDGVTVAASRPRNSKGQFVPEKSAGKVPASPPKGDAPQFPVAFIQFTKQLRNMVWWFRDYERKHPEFSDVIGRDLIIIDDGIGNVVMSISNLAAYEFANTYYYGQQPETVPPVITSIRSSNDG